MYELSREAAATGTPALVRYGISDGDPYAPGLTCGGSLDVFASSVSTETFPGLDTVARDVYAGRPVAVATVLEHPNAAVVGRRLVVRPPSADLSELSSAIAQLVSDKSAEREAPPPVLAGRSPE